MKTNTAAVEFAHLNEIQVDGIHFYFSIEPGQKQTFKDPGFAAVLEIAHSFVIDHREFVSCADDLTKDAHIEANFDRFEAEAIESLFDY